MCVHVRVCVCVCAYAHVCGCMVSVAASAGQVEAEVLDKLDNLLQAGWGDDEYKEAFADM